jgi:cellulose synthase/poly-beta-1,6-N-acetylglucosamine synthase-like glycosyltransferase
MEPLLTEFTYRFIKELSLLLNDDIFIVFISLTAFHLTTTLGYFIYVSRASRKPWNLKISSDSYEPYISIIVPAYKETKVIGRKIENIANLYYPKHKLQVIIVGDPETINVAKNSVHMLNGMKVLLLEEKGRLGKAIALNYALKFTEGEIIATSDADAIWSPDTLKNAVKYFSDPIVAAVTGHEIISNASKNIHTYSEQLYRKTYYTMRLGESKIWSTMIFQGELALYRRSYLKHFESRPGYSDDTGTVIRLIKEGYRCIYIPEAKFADAAPPNLKDKIKLKSRRGQHLINVLTEALKYKIKGMFPLPVCIVVANFYMHVLAPIIQLTIPILLAVSLIRSTALVTSILLVAILATSMLNKNIRALAELYITSSLALSIALIRNIMGMKSTLWERIESMREI